MTTMTAADVRESLQTRWPDSEYLVIPEAPQDAARAGRKIDLLVVSLWASRGFALDAVEVKVSMSDWKRELDNPEKADWWWRHSHRFWLAVPTAMADKVLLDLPESWGLLACAPGGCKPVVKAKRHDPEPLPWSSTIGVMRACADAGVGALYRAQEAGRRQGYEEGERRAKQQSGQGWAERELERLRERVAEFQKASGVDINESWSGGDVGRAVAVAMNWKLDPLGAADRLLGLSKRLSQEAKKFTELSAEVGQLGAVDVDGVA